MNLWIKKTLIGLAGVTLFAGALAGCGSRGWSNADPERETEMRNKMIERVSDRLDLDDAQKLKLNVLADEMLAQRRVMRGNGAGMRTELQSLVQGNQFDRSRAQNLLTEKTDVLQTGGPKVIDAMGDFYDSLNPAQQEQVRERLAKRGGHGRHGWWGRG